MTRYIDADKLIAHLKDEIKECEIPFGSRANGKSIAYGTALGLKSAISFAETLSTADVVPKSEVERLQHILDSYALQYGTVMDKHKVIEKARAEVAREFAEEVKLEFYREFDEIIPSIMADKIDDLVKKYTEDTNNENQSKT